MELELANRIALVTGASAGIGRQIAKQLAAEGARLIIVARREHLLASLADEVVKAGGLNPVVIAADLYDRDTPDRIGRLLSETASSVDILVNDAGGSRRMDISGTDDEWDESFALNFTAVRKMTQMALPSMMERRWGRILNITGSTEPAGVNAAGAAKSAVHSWAKGLSRSIGAHAITINCITPGRIHSEQIDQRLYPTAAAQEAFARQNIPMGYFGDPSDVANLAVFLCSARARYITGQRICVDGGMHRAVA